MVTLICSVDDNKITTRWSVYTNIHTYIYVCIHMYVCIHYIILLKKIHYIINNINPTNPRSLAGITSNQIIYQMSERNSDNVLLEDKTRNQEQLTFILS